MSNNPHQLFNELANFELNKEDSDRYDIFTAALSTIQPNNTPYSRSVLITDTACEKFHFITSIVSSKCDDIRYNNNTSLLFRWKNNQIIITGKAYICSNDLNDEYWNKRTLTQKQSSWDRYTSLSSIIKNKYNIEKIITPKYIQLPIVSEYIPLPRVPTWGVVQIKPTAYDFTIDNENNKKRLHFKLNSNGEWINMPDKFTVILGEY